MTSPSFLTRAVNYIRALLRWVFIEAKVVWFALVPMLATWPVVAAFHYHKRAYLIYSLALQVVGAVIAFKGISDNLEMFAGREWDVYTLRERCLAWWRTKPSWSPGIGSVAGPSNSKTKTSADMGPNVLTVGGVPAGEQIAAIEQFVNRLSAANHALTAKVKELESTLAKGIESAVAAAKEDQKKTVKAIAGGADEQIIGISILVWGGALASWPDIVEEAVGSDSRVLGILVKMLESVYPSVAQLVSP